MLTDKHSDFHSNTTVYFYSFAACFFRYFNQHQTKPWFENSNTDYGLDGPGIESPWGRYFSHLFRPALRPTQPPVQWVPGVSWG
jgi:hypothetical protein